MKRWGLITAALYTGMIVILTVPFLWAAFPRAQPSVLFPIYGAWQYWAFIGLMALCEAALLIAPVQVKRSHHRRVRSIYLTYAVAALLMALMLVALALSISELLRFNGLFAGLWIPASLLGFWALWAGILFWVTRRSPPLAAVRRIWRILLAGSILELLIAVPTHVIVRQRNECCAGFFTFVGLVTGSCVMLLSLGPGVYFLLAERRARIDHPS